MNCLRYYKTVKNEHIYKRTDKIHNHRKKLSRNVAHIAKWRVLKNEQTTSNLPNKTKKEPPMTGSGIVKNKASNFVKIAKTIINNAEYWTTLRLPTCDSPSIDRHYTPQTQQRHVTMTVCHYVMTVTTCDSPGIDRHYTPQTQQQHVTMTVCHYVMKHINQQLTHLCETNDTDVNTGWRSTIARTHDTIQQRPNAFNKYSWTHQTHQTTSAVTNGQRK